MKPPPEEAACFISALKEFGWTVRGNLIYSEEGFLHFLYPDGWDDRFSRLWRILTIRLMRFQDVTQKRLVSEDERATLIRVHRQALEAINKAKKKSK